MRTILRNLWFIYCFKVMYVRYDYSCTRLVSSCNHSEKNSQNRCSCIQGCIINTASNGFVSCKRHHIVQLKDAAINSNSCMWVVKPVSCMFETISCHLSTNHLLKYIINISLVHEATSGCSSAPRPPSESPCWPSSVSPPVFPECSATRQLPGGAAPHHPGGLRGNAQSPRTLLHADSLQHR